MPKMVPGTSTQNFAPDVKHKKHPMPELPKKPKVFDKKPAGIPAKRSGRRR